jgi:hypothetical protein
MIFLGLNCYVIEGIIVLFLIELRDEMAAKKTIKVIGFFLCHLELSR